MLPKCKQELLDTLKGNHPLIYIISNDERPVIETINRYIDESQTDFRFNSWDWYNKAMNVRTGNGVTYFEDIPPEERHFEIKIPFDEKAAQKNKDQIKKKIPYKDIGKILKETNGNRIYLISDLHQSFKRIPTEEINGFIRSVKEYVFENLFPFTDEYHLPSYKTKDAGFRKHLIFISPTLDIPKEWENYIHIIHFDNPNVEETKKLVDSFLQHENFSVDELEKEKLIESCLGMSETQMMLALRKSFYLNERKNLSIKHIQSQKEQIMRKNSGLIDFIEVSENMDSIGGFEELFKWLDKRKVLFNEANRQKYNLSYPKGTLLTGIQGCGKSLAAKIIASEFNFPLIRLDVGKLFGRYLGESEQNLRTALRTIEQMAPCVLWLDEIEKSLSTETGHQTTERMIGTLLTWMQEYKEPIFIVGTANNLEKMPPELLRKGRFDEIWFVDLPNFYERISIFKTHLNQRNISLSEEEISELADRTYGFSGAEIEHAIKESALSSLYTGEEINGETVLQEIQNTKPLSVTHKEKVAAIRKWAHEHQLRNVTGKPQQHNPAEMKKIM